MVLFLLTFFILFSNSYQFIVEKQNATRAKIIDKDDGKSSLVFVFDTTGSMHNDLRQLRAGAEMILKTALEESNVIADFVFVPFHDPAIGPATVTKDKEVFKAALQIVHVYGGGDCPEKSLGGLLLALNVSRPRSFVYVFTDATASDHRLVGKVLDAVQRKQSQVVFVLTGHCNDLTKPTFKVYEQIAAASSGQIFNLNKNNVHKVLDFVRTSIKGRSVNLASSINPPGYNYTQKIPVDKTVNEVTVSVSGAKPQIRVVNPSGEEITGPPQLVTTLDLSEIMIVKVLEPEPGNWSITVGSSASHSVRVLGTSDLSFSHGFAAQTPQSMKDTGYRPMKGTYNHMMITLSKPDAPVKVKYAEILNLEGKSLFEVPLVKKQDGVYLADAFLPPDELFYLSINGVDESGQDFRRVGTTAVQAKLPDAPYLVVPQRIQARTHEHIVLSCEVDSLVPVTVAWYKDSVSLQRGSSLQSTTLDHDISDVREGHAGSYTCVAGNAAGTTSAETVLEIIVDPPQISVLPANTSILIDEDLTITCSVFSEALLYGSKIIFNGTDEDSVLDFKLEPNLDGIYTFNKSIKNVSERDAGLYTCLARNRGGITNTSTHIAVITHPHVQIIGPHTLTAHEHTDIQITCDIENALHMHWLDPNRNILDAVSVNGSYKSVFSVKDLKEDGTWTCVASRKNYTASDSIHIKLLINPEVKIEGSRNITVLNGTTVLVNCIVRAKPEPEIVWYRDNEKYIDQNITKISNNTYKSTLILDSTKENINGTYFCSGENSEGTDKDNITVRVRRKMTLLEGFADQSVELYSKVELPCKIDSYPLPTISWYHNSTRIINSTKMAENSTIYIEIVDFDDLGMYSCVADNSYEVLVVNATLSVHGLEAPVISKETTKKISQEGKSIILTCSLLKGKPEPKITWRYKSHNSSDFTNLTSDVSVIDNKIMISNVSIDSEGIYRCVAENIIGRDEYYIELVVQYAPKLLYPEEKNDLQVKVGNSLKLSCNVTGSPKPVVVWTKNDQPIVFSRNIHLSEDNDLIIANVSQYETGVFACKAVSSLGSVARNFTLNVYEAPTIYSTNNQELELLEGQLVELPCSARGVPNPAVWWQHNGNNITNRIYVDEYGIRFVANLTDFGNYSCIASNDHGTATFNYTLFVWMPPSITLPFEENKNVLEASNVTLSCDAIGFPIPDISWEFNGEMLTENTTEISFNNIGNLYIQNVSSDKVGEYVCVAENIAGFDVKRFLLDIHEPPRIISNNLKEYIGIEGRDTAITLSCKAAGKPRPYVVWMNDEYYLDRDSPFSDSLGSSDDSFRSVSQPPLDITLSSIFLDVPRNFNLVHINAQSIPAHFPDLLTSFLSTNIHAILISESWLKPNLPSSAYTLPGFNLVRNDRTGRGGGGVAIYIRSHISYKLLFSSPQPPPPNSTENILLEVHLSKSKILVGIFYSPSLSIDYFSNFEDLLDLYSPQYDHSILMGDFNTCLLKGDCRSKKLLSLLNSHNLQVLPLNPTHFFPGCNPSLLDLMIVSSPSLVAKHGQCPADAFSFHDLIYLSYNLRPPKFKPSTVMLRNFVGIDLSQLSVDAKLCDWQSVVDAVSIDGKINLFNNLVIGLYDKHAPSRPVKRKHTPAPWLSPDLKSLLNKKNRAKAKLKSAKTDDAREKYKAIRNRCNVLCRDAQRRHFHTSIENGDSVKIWNFLKSLGVDSRYNIDSEGSLTINLPSVEMSGNYTCVARNYLGNVTENVKVNIYPLPIAQSDEALTKVTLEEGKSAEVECPVKHAQEIKWYKDSTLISTGSLKFPNVSRSHSGTYSCVVSNTVGSAHSSVSVDVAWAPRFHANPGKHEDVTKGWDWYFDCEVDAKPRAKTKWLFNSKLLLGEDRDKLVVLNIKPHHAGEYKCIVSNEYGTVSREFTLGVLVPPFISEFDVLDVQLKEGANATLDCNAKGVPEPNVTWSFDNTNWHIINTSLTSTSVTPESEGTFRCVAINKVGVAHLVYNVTVVSVARVKSIVVFRNGEGTDLEGSVDVALNSNVRIACEAKGNPKPTIQWFKHGNNISQNDKGASYADLTFDSVAITQAGTYICIAVNEGGIDERQLKINVLEPPTIFKTLFRNDNTTDSPIKLEVMSDQSFFMHCHAYGYPMPDIYWFKDGLPLRLYDDSMVSKEYGEIIAVNGASEEHSGNYTCVARNGVGETSVIYLIDVLVAPPQQKDNTKHVNLLFGKPLNLTCPVEGKPLPYVMWVKHPYTEIAETERIHLINDNYTLLINETEVLDTGKYSCIMTNKVGSTEIIYDVIIEKPPSIARNIGNNITERHVVPLRRSIVLKCEVDGNPPPKISWLKDIQKLSDNLANVQNVQGHSVLAVWSANTRDAGRYICVAENTAGTAHRVYELVVKVPGKWSAWSGWGYCNATCGRGVQVRTRICQHIDDSNHTYDKSSQTDKIILDESACKGSSVEQRKCQMPPCEESISEWSHWSRWSVCSATCGAATQARTRRCRVRDCSGDNVQIRRCRGLPPCPTPKRQRLKNDVYSSADNEDNGLSDFLPEATFEIGPDIEQQYNSQPSNEEFDDYYTAPTSSMPTYYDVNVTENLDGSERGPCDAGFKHNAEENTCIDVDECHLPLNLCHSTQVCANRAGGYRCACPRGYRAAGPHARCLDINECALNISGCEFACVNVAGGYVCACPTHLRLHTDRHHCVPPSKYNKPRYSYEDMDTEDYLSTSIDYPAR
ncbi:unnamed protein product [Colias eurytheme]|nr:unnamed protein product [Colias eurytheme]